MQSRLNLLQVVMLGELVKNENSSDGVEAVFGGDMWKNQFFLIWSLHQFQRSTALFTA